MTARRQVVLGAVGVAGLAVAGGVAWRSRAASGAPRAALPAEVLAFWGSRFVRPEGGELVIGALRGRPLLVNFWATWCPPCVKEMPEIDRVARAMAPRGWQVVGLAIDSPAPVQAFLARTPVGYPIGLAGLTGTDLARGLGNTSGALPFTALFDRDGALVRRKLGETNAAELMGWADAA